VWYDDLWPTVAELHQDFTRSAMGVRMSGAAAANLVHLAAGATDAYWQVRFFVCRLCEGCLCFVRALFLKHRPILGVQTASCKPTHATTPPPSNTPHIPPPYPSTHPKKPHHAHQKTPNNTPKTQFNLKPWDVAAGVCILEEAGGRVSTADGLAYSVFDRSLLATNDALCVCVLVAFAFCFCVQKPCALRLGLSNLPLCFVSTAPRLGQPHPSNEHPPPPHFKTTTSNHHRAATPRCWPN
jgi:hypothetical protein